LGSVGQRNSTAYTIDDPLLLGSGVPEVLIPGDDD
jgi:hypothetical protein